MSEIQPSNLRLYAQRDTYALSPHFERHMLALTSEGLTGKAAIARELAYRDSEIERLTVNRDAWARTAEARGAEILRLLAALTTCQTHDYRTLADDDERPTAANAQLQAHGADMWAEVKQLRAEIERLRALMPATTAIPASVLDASIAALVSERDRLRAALTEILEFDPHPTAKDVARRALGLETGVKPE